MTKELFKAIRDFSLKQSEGHHDAGHLARAEAFAERICEKEGGDWGIIYPAVRLHDIGRSMDIPKHPQIGAEMARVFLESINYSREKIPAIWRAILVHDDHQAQVTLEEKVVYDADRLDCFSYSGLMRCFLEIARTGISITEPRRPVGNTLSEMIPEVWSYLDIAFRSLNTATAREIANEYRRQFLDDYLMKIKSEQI